MNASAREDLERGFINTLKRFPALSRDLLLQRARLHQLTRHLHQLAKTTHQIPVPRKCVKLSDVFKLGALRNAHLVDVLLNPEVHIQSADLDADIKLDILPNANHKAAN